MKDSQSHLSRGGGVCSGVVCVFGGGVCVRWWCVDHTGREEAGGGGVRGGVLGVSDPEKC